MLRLGVVSLVALLLVACGSDSSSTEAGGSSGSGGTGATGGQAGSAGASGGSAGAAPEKFRAVFLADSHVIGPQYECCENSPADTASIVKTEERLRAVKDKINTLDPPPVMGFLLGDVVHDAYHSQDKAWYQTTVNSFSIAAEILKDFNMPIHLVWGNHDYHVECDAGDPGHYSREFGHELFMEFFEQPPYQAVDHGGWKFVLTNGQLGPSWTPGSPDCATSIASYGREQLSWIDDQLSEGKPTILMSHYMRLITMNGEDPDGPVPDLPYLIDNHDNVKAFMVGHTHRWMDLDAINFGKFHWVLGATRYDTDNFWVVEFDREGNWEILDFDKIIRTSSCAMTFDYSDPTEYKLADPQPEETGDCVMGLE